MEEADREKFNKLNARVHAAIKRLEVVAVHNRPKQRNKVQRLLNQLSSFQKELEEKYGNNNKHQG